MSTLDPTPITHSEARAAVARLLGGRLAGLRRLDLGKRLGAPALSSSTAYRVMHTRHRDHLGTEDDPDDYHNYTGRRGVVWALHCVRLTVGCYLYLPAIPFLAVRHGSPAERRAIAMEYA